jgi:hypothetical protein
MGIIQLIYSMAEIYKPVPIMALNPEKMQISVLNLYFLEN